jgi:hypothetical protein
MIDPKNVVVLHCQGPRGRSSLVAACFLAFFYKSEFSGGARDALKVYSQIADMQSPTTLLPSQSRYLGYFDEVLHGFIPLNKPLILQRLIINGIPDVTLGTDEATEDINDEEDDEESLQRTSPEVSSKSKRKGKRRVICAPYIQIFKNGKRVYQSIKKK